MGENIAREMRSGKKQSQAIAIAEDVRRKNMSKGGMLHDKDSYEHEEMSQQNPRDGGRSIEISDESDVPYEHDEDMRMQAEEDGLEHFANGGPVQGGEQQDEYDMRRADGDYTKKLSGQESEHSGPEMMGYDYDDDSELDGMHTDSDHMPDDLLSYDDKGSGFKSMPYDEHEVGKDINSEENNSNPQAIQKNRLQRIMRSRR